MSAAGSLARRAVGKTAHRATCGSGGTGKAKAAEKIGHYYPDMPPPVRAEVCVSARCRSGGTPGQ